MSRLSLRLRLALAGVAAICLALGVAGVGLTYLFERHVYRTMSDDLDVYVRQIVGALQTDPSGAVALARPPDDPRFEEPNSGLYWQISSGRQVIRSRSLWDAALPLPEDLPSEPQTHYHQIAWPGGKLLLVAERRIYLQTPAGRAPVRIAVASDLTRLRQARDAFAADLAPALALLALVLGGATWVQLSLGLKPLARLRDQIEGVAGGRTRRLSEDAPREVLPLVREVNHLLDAQEATIARARGRAADLAHGLKTPLAALAADARTLREGGQNDVADSIETVGETMRRHVERELARARIGGDAMRRSATPVREIVDAIVRTLVRTERGERLDFANSVPDKAEASIERTDLTEVLGNLIENATRHADARVRVTYEEANSGPRIAVEDDGPGIDPAMESLVRQRGGRLDHSGAAGLGLAIVQDVLDAYGWTMRFGRSPLGGLSVQIGPGGVAGGPSAVKPDGGRNA